MKNNVYVALKSFTQKNLKLHVLKVTDENSKIRIRVRIH